MVKILFSISLFASTTIAAYRFPDKFLFGAATAAYQVEGGWDEDGRGECILDRAIHEHPDWIIDGRNADVACDSYHKYKEDVKLLKGLGVDFYRFSISWTRILPTGKVDKINHFGIDYYNNLIDELLANGIEPYVTMFHFDMPQSFTGWPEFVDCFVDYARVLFKNFGDRVKHWMTFNELRFLCQFDFNQGLSLAYINKSGVSDYQSCHFVLLGHGKIYRMYEAEFRETQNGQISTAIDSVWYEPRNASSKLDQEASEIAMQMKYGWFMNPMVYGNYPDVMIERVRNVSLTQGYNQSRLPEFTPEEQEMLRGTLDFVALIHYTTYKVYFGEGQTVLTYQEPFWPNSTVNGIKSVPWGIRRLLVWIRNHYDNRPVIISENGINDNGTLEDYGRADYHKGYLNEILKAIHEEGCNVIGYTAWSLMDTFEWTSGYSTRLGLHHVDFDDPDRPRTRKLSSYVYSHIIKTRQVNLSYVPNWPPPRQLHGTVTTMNGRKLVPQWEWFAVLGIFCIYIL